jgi:hypothetical protein
MAMRIGPATVVTTADVVAAAAHVSASGAAHALVQDGTVKSTHALLNLVTGSLNEVDAALSGDAAKKFNPEKAIVTCTMTECPAYLEGGAGATAVVATWNACTGPASFGEFGITINGTAHDCAGGDFAACLTMDDVALVIQGMIRTATGGLETVAWAAGHFLVSSVDTAPGTSRVTVTRAVAAPAGTDISGVGATAFMDCDVGHGIPHNPPTGTTAKITIGTAHAGTDVLAATVLTGLIDEHQAFEIPLVGLFPDIAGNATMHVKATVGDGAGGAQDYQVMVEIVGTES